MNDRVYIFDTTLRDGEQSPGCSMNATEKLEVAQELGRLKVDVIEAGFPVSSPGDFSAVKRIAETVGRGKKGAFTPQICGLSRSRNKPDLFSDEHLDGNFAKREQRESVAFDVM